MLYKLLLQNQIENFMIVKIIYYAFVAALLVGFSCLVAAISDKPFEDAFWQYFEMFLFLCITIKIANWADRKVGIHGARLKNL